MPRPGNANLAAHVREIERCNQRGGRFLSIIDLIEAGTLDLELAAYLGAAILAGSSFLVGARPGGAGKTTVMGALLNFVPPDRELMAATAGVPASARRPGGPKRCYVCHEIGTGPYFAYLWGQDVCDFFALPEAGQMGATNLHADTVEEAREILVGGCGVSPEAFAAWPLLVFLRVEAAGSFRVTRRIDTVWEGPDRLRYRLAAGGDGRPAWHRRAEPQLGQPAVRERVRELLLELQATGRRSLEEVRAAVLDRFG